MSFKTSLAADVANVFMDEDVFAEAVTYAVAATGASSAMTAVFELGQDLGAAQFGMAASATVHLSAASIAAPAAYDTITRADGSVWTLRSVLSSDGYAHTVICDSDQRQIPRGANV